LVATVFFQNRVSIGHIGDSRCYRLRADKFEQLTHDHSLLQEQIDSGMLTPEQAKYSLNKNLVTRALGIEAIVPADIAEYRVEANDIYLLCSDGLTDMVDPEVVHGIVDEKRTELPEAAAELIELANQNGGRDNPPVILATPVSFRRRPTKAFTEAHSEEPSVVELRLARKVRAQYCHQNRTALSSSFPRRPTKAFTGVHSETQAFTEAHSETKAFTE